MTRRWLLFQAAASGEYETTVSGLSPDIYLDFAGDAVDNSGNGRDGTLGGTGGSFAAAALPSGVGAGNSAFDTEGSAFITVAHASADVALTFPSDWETEQSTDGYRFIGDATASIWFKPNALPTGSDKHVIVAKSSSQTPGVAASYDGSWEAYIDANGAMHVECRSFRGRPCRIRTPDGAVAAGTTYHLVVQLSYDGVAAWLDGAKFEDGYANLLHVFGLAADIRGTTLANTFDWTLGKAAWGGQADCVVDEFAVYLRAPSATISQSNVNDLAEQVSAPAALAHHIWGAFTVNESSYASIQAAVDDVFASGGGTVLIDAGSYTENVTLKSNVRLKANGGTVTINGWVRTATISTTSLGVGTGDLGVGDRTLDISNSIAAGDLVYILGTAGNPSPVRHDRRWNTDAESNDPAFRDAELFEVESRTASVLTFTGHGSEYGFPAADRDDVRRFTPTEWVAIEGDIRVASAGASSDAPITIRYAKNFRLVGCRATNTTGPSGQGLLIYPLAIYGQLREATLVQPDAPTSENDGIGFWASSDIVGKDCSTIEGRHGVDFSQGTPNFPQAIRCEHHGFDWDNTNSHSTPGSKAAIGTHGSQTHSIFWNCTTNWGGPAISGWQLDYRFMVCGDSATASSGEVQMNDGAGDSYGRDIHILRPANWFRAVEGAVGVDRNHFENITRSATPTGVSHSALNYGTGADVNTYTNVDGPDASWTLV